jgi:mono/diheme cytochrome c family protein
VAPARCTRARIFSRVGKRAGAGIFGLAAGVLVAALVAAGAAEQKNTTRDQRKIDRGRYLVKIAGCNDCHTAGYGMAEGNVAESQWLMGDKRGFRGAWGTTYAGNLRLIMNSLTETQWVAMAKNSKSRPPMPWWTLHEMGQEDLKALYAYVKWLGPAGEPAPSYEPLGQEPAGPVVQFPQ